jgi:hypothetical protein
MVLICLSLPSTAQLAKLDPPRTWTTAKGDTFTANLVSFDGTTVTVKLPNAQYPRYPLAHFSDADQKYLIDWKDKQPLKFTMPELVGVDVTKIKTEVVSEDEAAEKFVYRTDHFEYESQGKFSLALLREIGRTFEATYELLKAMPWNIAPEPPSGTHFKARLFKNREEYIRGGGPPRTAGVYKPSEEAFLAPFDSIGVKSFGKGYTKDASFDTSTMVHELTHEMMHNWLGYIPSWIAEGTAEYAAILPFANGRFRVVAARAGLRVYTETLKDPATGAFLEPYPLDKLFKIGQREWNAIAASNAEATHRMYVTSYLLVYYFMHLDGNGDGQRFMRYFREVDKERKKGGGEYRGDDKEYHERMLKILLDGRTEEELMKQIRLSFKKYSIRLP